MLLGGLIAVGLLFGGPSVLALSLMFSTVLTITSPCPYRNLKPHHLHEGNAPCTAPSLRVSRICPLVRPASSASTALPLDWPKQRKERSRARFQSEGCQAQKRRMQLVHHHTPASSASEKTARLLKHTTAQGGQCSAKHDPGLGVKAGGCQSQIKPRPNAPLTSEPQFDQHPKRQN